MHADVEERSRAAEEIAFPEVSPMHAGVMWYAEECYFVGVLPLHQFMENCAADSDWDPDEAADFDRHPRACRTAMAALAARVAEMARRDCPEARSRALGIAVWCLLNHPDTGFHMRRRLSDAVRAGDRVAVTLSFVDGEIFASFGTGYVRPGADDGASVPVSKPRLH